MRYTVAQMTAAARRFGLTVEVVPGAETRGDTTFNPKVFVGHHTAGPATGIRPSLSVCVNGRTDLAGPLCNWFLDRDGVCIIVATGRANHAGAGGFRGVTGNSGAQGCEAEDNGDGTWTAQQLWWYPRVVAAGLSLMGQDPSWYCAHRTWAPTRKIDPAGISDDWMRRQVAAVLDGTAQQDDTNTEEDPFMALTASDMRSAIGGAALDIARHDEIQREHAKTLADGIDQALQRPSVQASLVKIIREATTPEPTS